MSWPRPLLALLIVCLGLSIPPDELLAAGGADDVAAAVKSLIDNRQIAGAQLVLADASSALDARSFGVCRVGDDRTVNDSTRFCIGSCSKMFAAAVVVAVASDGGVDLDTPVDRWLRAFARPRLVGGERAQRAPTLRELLCHRGGIYSQRNRLTEKQSRWIRDFRLSLAESAQGIIGEPLTCAPGQEFGYSGAGYCLVGHVAAVATGRSFDELLSIHVTRPLKLERTSYFPSPADRNIAVGHRVQDGRLSVDRRTPHLLGQHHRLALIGGSLYAPAHEVARFGRMLLRRGQGPQGHVLTHKEWQTLTSPHAQRTSGRYALGLTVTVNPQTGELQSASHGGALYGSFSYLVVDFRTQRVGVVTYTGKRTNRIRDRLLRWAEPETGGD